MISRCCTCCCSDDPAPSGLLMARVSRRAAMCRAVSYLDGAGSNSAGIVTSPVQILGSILPRSRRRRRHSGCPKPTALCKGVSPATSCVGRTISGVSRSLKEALKTERSQGEGQAMTSWLAEQKGIVPAVKPLLQHVCVSSSACQGHWRCTRFVYCVNIGASLQQCHHQWQRASCTGYVQSCLTDRGQRLVNADDHQSFHSHANVTPLKNLNKF